MDAGALLHLAVLADHLAMTVLMDLINGGVLAIMFAHNSAPAGVHGHGGGGTLGSGGLRPLDGEAIGQLLVIRLGGNCSEDRESGDHDGGFRQVLH
jgi:hypothetical protein